MELGCNRRRRGEEHVSIETASMELARLAGEPLTVGKEVRRGEAGRTSSEDSKLTRAEERRGWERHGGENKNDKYRW